MDISLKKVMTMAAGIGVFGAASSLEAQQAPSADEITALNHSSCTKDGYAMLFQTYVLPSSGDIFMASLMEEKTQDQIRDAFNLHFLETLDAQIDDIIDDYDHTQLSDQNRLPSGFIDRIRGAVSTVLNESLTVTNVSSQMEINLPVPDMTLRCTPGS